jgi:hypothetical protein
MEGLEVKINYREQVADQGKSTLSLLLAVLLSVALFQPGNAEAGTLEATPKVIIKYSINENIYANDPDELPPGDDLVTAGYIDYLLGLSLKYQERRHVFEVNGNAGYEQFVSVDGWVENAADDSPGDYDSVSISAGALYKYLRKDFIFEIHDSIRQTRDLQEIFGEATDALGYWALFTHNILGTSIKFSPTSKLRYLIRYDYSTLYFADPENDMPEPTGAYEHRFFIKSEYFFSSKTTGIMDLQGANRVFEDIENDLVLGGQTKAADYMLIQGLLGLRYNFNSATYIEALGGYAQRTFDNLSETLVPFGPYIGTLAFDVEDTSSTVAIITFNTKAEKRYSFAVKGTQGISTYGQNLFFDYLSAMTSFKYHFTPKIYSRLAAQYQQSIYDLEDNSREWVWNDDRVDNTTYASASLNWDILQKRNQGTLSLAVGYAYQNRDSSIDSADDYEPTYAFLSANNINSFDAVTNVYYIRLQILPTILLGD